MRIAVDGVRLSRKPSGVTFIVISIIKQLAIQYPSWDINVLLRTEIHPSLKGILVEDNIKFITSPPSILNSKSLFWSLFQLNRMVSTLNPDYFIAPNTLLYPLFAKKKIKKVFFVHDLIFKTWPATMSFLNKIQLLILFKYSIKTSNIVWCNSNYTKQELLDYYGQYLNTKPVFVGAGLNVDFKAALANYNSPPPPQVQSVVKPYIIFVGTFEPRKNIPFLLQVFEQLSNKFDLIIVGSKGWGNAESKISDILNAEHYPKYNVKIIDNIELVHLIELYKKAAFYLSTSFNEGLGLPLLEAMACGCPVICAHNSAMIEVTEGAGITVKSWKIDDWLAAVSEVELNREYYVELGYNRVKNFDWENVITSFVKLLK